MLYLGPCYMNRSCTVQFKPYIRIDCHGFTYNTSQTPVALFFINQIFEIFIDLYALFMYFLMQNRENSDISQSMGKLMSKHINSNENNNNSKEEIKENSGGNLSENREDAGLPEDSLPADPEAKPENPGPGSADLQSGEQKIAELEAKLADLNDQYLRKAADFENFRKRTIREKQEISEFANQNLILDLLPVLDDFERAVKSAQSSLAAQTSKDFAGFYEGVTMIQKRLSSELENKWGLKRFESEGEPFDPNRHEALQVEKVPGIEEPVVKDDFLKGYTLKDRVIRFAKVKVLMPEPADHRSDAEAKGRGSPPEEGPSSAGDLS